MPEEKIINGRKYSDLLRLAADEEFQKRLADDPIIQCCFDTRNETTEDRLLDLLMVFNSPLVVGGKAIIQVPTIGLIAVLDAIDSPFIHSDKTMDVTAVDMALQLLIHGKEAINQKSSIINDLRADSKGLCERLGLDVVVACRGIFTAINSCFRAFKNIREKLPDSQKKQRFNSFWLASMIAMVSRVSNLTPYAIMWDMPMPLISNLIVQSRKLEGWNVRESTSAFVAMEQLEKLIDVRLAEYEAMKNGK